MRQALAHHQHVVLGVALFLTAKLVFLWHLCNQPNTLALLTRWDGERYLYIGEHGYAPMLDARGHPRASNLAFFPLYPMLARVVSRVTFTSMATALCIVALISGVLAAWGLVRLGEQLASARVGVALAALWGLVPRSFLQTMAYSESLFTALSVWSLVWLSRERRWAAAITCAAAGLTRPTGATTLLAVGGALLAWWFASLKRPGRDTLRLTAQGLLAGSGLLLAWLHVAWRRRDWWGYLAVQREWHMSLGSPRTTWDAWWTVVTAWRAPVPRHWWPVMELTWALPAWTLFAVLLAVMAVRKRMWWPVAAQALAMWCLAMSTQQYYNSKERFLLPAVGLLLPLSVALGALWRWRAGRVLLAVLWLSAVPTSAWWGELVVTSSYRSP